MIPKLAQRAIHATIPCFAIAAASAAPVVAAASNGVEATRTAGLVRAHADYPTIASVAFGVIVAKLPQSFECRTTPCLFSGLTLQAAAGVGGGEVALGFGRLTGETGRGNWLIRRPYIGYGVRAAALRTWGEAALVPAGDTFLGVEGAFTVAQFGIRLGVFRRTETVQGEKDWRLFGGMGWGF